MFKLLLSPSKNAHYEKYVFCNKDKIGSVGGKADVKM